MTTISLPGYNATIGNLNILGSLMVPTLLLFDNAATQNVVHGTQTPITFGTIITNTLSNSTLSNSNSLITYTGSSGQYWLITYSCGSQNAPTDPTGRYNTFIRVNGTTRYGQTLVSTGTWNQCVLSGSAIIYMNPNDYIEFVVYQNSTNNLVTSTVSTTSFPSSLSILAL